MKIKNILIGLILIGLLVISASAAFATSATVDGVDFELDDGATITIDKDTLVNFKMDNGVTGFISTVDDIDEYTQNNTEYGYAVIELNTTDDGEPKMYAYADEGLDEGYFLLFQKDNKNFVYYLESSDVGNDQILEDMAEAIFNFKIDNKDLKPVA